MKNDAIKLAAAAREEKTGEATVDYRLFIIYRIKKLKVLDGVGVSSREVAGAKEMYCGKLTRETVTEKVGHAFFEHMREVNLVSLKLKDVEILTSKEFHGLRELNLDNNVLTNLCSLSGLVNLSVLRCNYNRIERLGSDPVRSDAATDLRSLSRTSSRKEVKLGGGGGGPDPEPVVNLPNLEVLHLGYNRVSSISDLSLHSFPNLCSLFLQGNDIGRVDGLESCGELRSLTLDKNRIRSFEPNSLSGLLKLKDLRVEENGLRSLSNFPVLPSLTVLSAAGNRISDVIELEKLCRVCDAREVSFANNPVTRKQLYRTSVVGMFPNVRVVDGREVTQEERERSLHVLHQPTASAVGFLQQHLAQPQGVAAQASIGGWGVQRDMNPQQMLLEQQQAQQHARNRAQSLKGEGGMVPSLKATVKLTAVQVRCIAVCCMCACWGRGGEESSLPFF